ncbi:MAG: TetR/AcrR family transcriptional regulator [Burkholderiaceae bacterium]
MEALLRTSRTKLLDGALKLIRTKGYTASTVEEFCAAASVTKGSFFHHFKGKQDLVLATITHWNARTGALFEQAPYQQIADPRDRVLAYIDFRAALLQGELADFTCLLGTLVQETFETQPLLRTACNEGIAAHAQTVASHLDAAKRVYAPHASWEPEAVAYYTQAVIQGAFILAKAQGGPLVAAQCIAQLRTHVANFLGAPSHP